MTNNPSVPVASSVMEWAFPDAADWCLALPTDEPITAEDPLWAAMLKLSQQFIKEGRCQDWYQGAVAAGRIVVFAWSGAGDLSGCSKDKVNQVQVFAQERGGVTSVGVHGMPVQDAQQQLLTLTRKGLREALASGAVTAESPTWPIGPLPADDWRRLAAAPLATGAWSAVYAALTR